MTEKATELTERKGMNCSNCKKVTDTKEPVFVKKSKKGNRYYLQAYCADCPKKKSRPVAETEFKCLSKEQQKEIKNLDNGDEHALDSNNGGLLPLLPLLGAIFSGIAAASTATGAIANTVISKKSADEEKRHNEAREKILREAASEAPATGSGVPNSNLQVSDEENGKKSKKKPKKVKKTEDQKITKAINFLEERGYKITMDLSDSD